VVQSATEWEQEIITFLIDKLECSNSDAQGVLEANNFEMRQEWAKGSDSLVAATRILSLAGD
jgi:hypothetical protein